MPHNPYNLAPATKEDELGLLGHLPELGEMPQPRFQGYDPMQKTESGFMVQTPLREEPVPIEYVMDTAPEMLTDAYNLIDPSGEMIPNPLNEPESGAITPLLGPISAADLAIETGLLGLAHTESPYLAPAAALGLGIGGGRGLRGMIPKGIAESKLAGLDVSLDTLNSEYESLLDERKNIIGNMDENFDDFRSSTKAYDLSVNTGLTGAELENLAIQVSEHKSAYNNARREYLAVQEFQKNPRILHDKIRYGDDWRVSVSRAQMEPDPNIDYSNLQGQTPVDLGTINLTETSTFKMAELATKISSIQSQRESLDISL